jgi:aldose 1-epimerase
MVAPMLIELAAGPIRVVLSPEAGGAIARFAVERAGTLVDIMRPPHAAALAEANARALASYPLVPFSNRIGRAGFRLDGRAYRLNRNFLPEPHAIHGDGWQHAWQVEAASSDRAILTYQHGGADAGGAGWPFRYRARQRFTVDAGGLTVEIGATNLEDRAWPFGCGLHPYFRVTPAMRLTAALPSVWLWDTLKLPVVKVPTPPSWDFAAGRAVAALSLDHCFAGWNGRAEIVWPELALGLTLEADALFGHCVIAVLPSSEAPDVVAIEPVSHANDAINLLDGGDAGNGLISIAPGATIAGRVRFALS